MDFLNNHIFVDLSLIYSLFLITWLPALFLKEFVSDDIEGLKKFSDKFENGKLVDTYDENGRTWKNRELNTSVPFPGNFIRWIRLLIGGKLTVIGNNENGHEVYGYVQSPFRHHAINLVLQGINLALAYFFLSNTIGRELALLSIMVFAVHPVGSQSVAWCSGIGYLICLMGALLTFNAAIFLPEGYGKFLFLIATNIISNAGLLSGFANFIILAVIGEYQSAMISGLVGLLYLFVFGKKTVDYRVNAFKNQEMSASTKINLSKLTLPFKTILYYFNMVIYPKRLGLFHEWGYHYDKRLVAVDKRFFYGVLLCSCLILAFSLFSLPVKLGIALFVCYLALFLNIITANQFVSERYVFISSLGYSILFAFFLKQLPVLFFFILGLYVCRSRMHIPTFNDEISFYLSNKLNFPKSEVALGNLGVAYSHRGKIGSAVDTWIDSANLNKFYAVPLYNLYSAFRNAGDISRAREYLSGCLKAKTVNFREIWTKELIDLDNQINNKEYLNVNNITYKERERHGRTTPDHTSTTAK